MKIRVPDIVVVIIITILIVVIFMTATVSYLSCISPQSTDNQVNKDEVKNDFYIDPPKIRILSEWESNRKSSIKIRYIDIDDRLAIQWNNWSKIDGGIAFIPEPEKPQQEKER